MKNLIYLFLIFLTFNSFGCSKKKMDNSPKPAPVKVTKAISKSVPKYIETVGHMEAYESVNIMAQVDGILLKTFFDDGSDIKKGELLYLIDERPYLADLEKAEGELSQNIANLGYAERTAERNSKLVKDDYISENDYDNLINSVIVNNSKVKQSRADVENAKINLGYTKIYSPLDARASDSQIDDGNLVLESAKTNLVTLNQIAPIYATFFINEKMLPEIQYYKNKNKNLKTLIKLDNKDSSTYEGLLTFVDNSIDLSTGMIKLKATLPNSQKVLWPNQYVKVKLILDTIEQAVIVPVEAIQESTKGKYVYIVKGNQSVELRNIKAGQIQDNNTIVVLEGIKSGEKVVTEGQINLYPHAKISIIRNEDDS